MVNSLAQNFRWQWRYGLYCYAYFPVTALKRLLLKSKRRYVGLDPLGRRFLDKWGFISYQAGSETAGHLVWLHMGTGGEVMGAWSLLHALEAQSGPYALATDSYDTYAVLAKELGKTRIFFSPWDLSAPARRVLRRLRPQALVFVQQAYFPIMLREAGRSGVKRFLINGLLSRNVARGNAALARALALEFYRELDGIAVQTEEDYDAFRKLGVPSTRLATTGNLGADFSKMRLTAAERARWRQELRMRDSEPVFIVGSAHPGEQQVMLDAFLALRHHVPDVRFIVAPRWIHEARALADAFTRAGFLVAMRSELAANEDNGLSAYDVLLLDTFGELRAVYGIADAAFIGSSLVPINERRGGHNPLEPLAHGVVPLFGPHMNLWPTVVRELRAAWPELEVDSAERLAERASQLLSGRAPISAIQAAGARLIERSSGAVDRTVAFLRQHLQLGESSYDELFANCPSSDR